MRENNGEQAPGKDKDKKKQDEDPSAVSSFSSQGMFPFQQFL